MRKDILAGVGAALLLFLIKQGVDPIPLILIGGAVVALRYYTKNRGFENGPKMVDISENTSISNITFADVGGQETAKRELLEALDFLKGEEEAKTLGIRPLKGILLTGPPGTGKTMMAKAAAHYTDSTFIASSGSEFIEMYAGVGAQRVRQLFAKARGLAKKSGKTGAVIFLDELEVLGGKRGKHHSHLEYDQTLNQLLVEMDGLKAENGIRLLVIGATNRPDLLDEALLRPGRFDRQVRIDLPEREGRLKILKIHTQNKPLAAEVDLEEVARDTFGFSGAHLEALVNEAAILSFRRGEKEIGRREIEEAIDKVILGERLERRPSEEELRRVAIHETGHALVSECLRPSSVANLTVTSRGKALGFMRPSAAEQQYLFTQNYLEEQIAIFLGGAMAEELVYGERSTGASNDFEQATGLAGQIVKSGLSMLGIVNLEYTPKERVHEVFCKILSAQEERAREIIRPQIETVKRVASLLVAKEKISGDQFRLMMKESA